MLLGTEKFKMLLWNTFFGISERHGKARSWVIFKNLEKLLTEHKNRHTIKYMVSGIELSCLWRLLTNSETRLFKR